MNVNSDIKQEISQIYSDGKSKKIKSPDRLIYSLSRKLSDTFPAKIHELIFPGMPLDNKISYSYSTSCIHNLEAICVLFSGLTKASAIMPKLSLQIEHTSNHETNTVYTLQSLFWGSILIQLGSKVVEKPFDWIELETDVNSVIDQATKSFSASFEDKKSSLPPEITNADKKITYIYQNLNFDFNRETYDHFENDLFSKESEINHEKSRMFYVVMKVPGQCCRPATKDEQVYHSFAIEQFWSEENKEVCYRLYQSWIHQNTISQDMEMRGYTDDPNKEWKWNKQEFKVFLKNFETIVCKSNLNQEEKRKCEKNAFGYGDSSDTAKLSYFDTSNLTMYGLTFRYTADFFNPKEIKKNRIYFKNT